MGKRALEATCRDCGRPLSFHAGGTRAVRCAECFDSFLRARDAEFLSSYAELGVTSRRVIAETSFRALVMESPPHRKVLAMHIMEQYVNAASDLVGLYAALKQRGREPVMKAFLEFSLDGASSAAFFREIAIAAPSELLAGLGIAPPEQIDRHLPSLTKRDAKDYRRTVDQLLFDLAFTAKIGETAALALAQMAGEDRARLGRGGGALVHQSAWLDSVGLRPDQVATMAIDAKRRTVNVTAISVDEKKLEQILTQINAMTRASQNMIYAVLTMYQEEARANASRRGVSPVASVRD
jgi:hypothetical protein